MIGKTQISKNINSTLIIYRFNKKIENKSSLVKKTCQISPYFNMHFSQIFKYLLKKHHLIIIHP